MFVRSLKLPTTLNHSLFLWGPRQTGKTSLIKYYYPESSIIDLLHSDQRIKYTEDPSLLRKELLAAKAGQQIIVIDEVQKVPDLLNEVHWLIENSNYKFVICGSSARKLKRNQANLLGGRAIRYELHGLTSSELKADFDLYRIVNHGYLPKHYLNDNPQAFIRSYVADYLTEEIAQEGLVRNLPKFSAFLRAAALDDCEVINYAKIASDCAVATTTVKEHFQILVDTLIGSYLPAYVKRQKRKVINAPKFYLFDVAVVNHLARRGEILLGSEQSGKAFENFIHHEIRSYRAYSEKYYDLSYWRLADAKQEVDFILNDMEIAIEVKTSERIAGHHLKSLYAVKKDNPNLKRVILVCREKQRRIEKENIEIIPYHEFLEELWAGCVL